MASTLSMSIVNSSLSRLCIPHSKYSSKTLFHRTLFHRTNPLLLSGERNLCSRSSVVLQSNRNSKLPCSNWRVERGLRLICSYKKDEFQPKESETEWPILKQWDVPWGWQKVSLTSLACVLSFILAGLIEMAALPSLGLQVGELSLDEKAEILFLDQAITTAVVLVVLRSLTNTSEPNSDDLFRYDWSKPFDLQRGWLLWAAIGLFGAVAGIAVTGAAVSFFNGATPERDTDALILLLPLIGSSTTSTACLVGITGVLAPILEETVFRGFLLVSLTKWLPTPVSVIISAAVFAAAHLTPAQFPPLFVLGIALGFSYAQTRNLVTPITIHAIWNSGVILLLTILQLQGYDIRELLQGS